MKLKNKIVAVDISDMLHDIGTILVEDTVELKLVEYYSYLQTKNNNTYSKFTKYVINKLYRDEVDHPVKDINTFFKEKIWINKVLHFIDKLESIIFMSVPIEIINIEYYKTIEYNEFSWIVEFNITYPERLKL